MEKATTTYQAKFAAIPDKLQYYSKIDNQYRIKLMSDTELAKGACMIFNKQLAGSSDTHSLESPMDKLKQVVVKYVVKLKNVLFHIMV